SRDSVSPVALVMLPYGVACALKGPHFSTGLLFNNLYFLVLTGIIAVNGSFVNSRLRFREFALRYELDRNKQMLEESNRKLKELDQIKSRFFANISHELRTPLTLLLAPLEALLHQRGRVTDPDTRDLLTTMHSNGMRLLKLINDTGMGISPKNLPYIFDRFWQADGSARRKYQGVGIGLALVKELTEIQEGQVSVESEEGQGTKFTVRLRCVTAEPKPESLPPQAPEEPSEPDQEGVTVTGTVASEEWLANLYRR